jgi:hypothetical protein
MTPKLVSKYLSLASFVVHQVYKGIKELLIVWVLFWLAVTLPIFNKNERFANYYNYMFAKNLAEQQQDQSSQKEQADPNSFTSK